VENRRAVERDFLAGLARATWVTFQIATLGSLLAAVLALPLGLLSRATCTRRGPLAWAAKGVLDVTRAIHTLVFGLVLVGIVGLGPHGRHPGHRAALHGHLRQALRREHRDARHGRGRRRARHRRDAAQVFFNAVWPSVLPQFVSNHLYVWEFNIRDSTILGLIGAGGLGLLISEAVSLFQWSRLATILLVVVALVVVFDALSRRIRQALL
jgi:phosphonate transport system permease protein